MEWIGDDDDDDDNVVVAFRIRLSGSDLVGVVASRCLKSRSSSNPSLSLSRKEKASCKILSRVQLIPPLRNHNLVVAVAVSGL